MQRASSIIDSPQKRLTDFLETTLKDEINNLRRYLVVITKKYSPQPELDTFTTPHSKTWLANTENCLTSLISLFSAYAKNKNLDNLVNHMQTFLSYVSVSKNINSIPRMNMNMFDELSVTIDKMYTEGQTFPGKEKIMEYLATINVVLFGRTDAHKLIPTEGLATNDDEARKSIEEFEHATFGK